MNAIISEIEEFIRSSKESDPEYWWVIVYGLGFVFLLLFAMVVGLIYSLINQYRFNKKVSVIEWWEIISIQYEEEHTTYMPIPSGKITITVPVHHPEKYVLGIEGEYRGHVYNDEISLSVEQYEELNPTIHGKIKRSLYI